MQNKVSRRKFLAGAGAGVGATAVISLAAGCGGSGTSVAPTTTPAPSTAITDVDILNFALNLEYLEAEFYLRAVTGQGLSAADIGPTPGAVTGGAQVPFATPAIQQYAVEVAGHEQKHVEAIRAAIASLGGTPVSRPAIDFTNAFNAAAVAAKIGTTFNPFDNETDFVLGSFVFEDVGVTAYNGAAPLIQNKTVVLPAAGGIVAVEAYHAGLIRYLISNLGATTPSVITTANAISALRAAASSVVSGGTGAAETPITVPPSTTQTLVAAEPTNSLGYSRGTDQVLHIVYLSATAGVVSKGGFFPSGLNGTITASLS